MRRVLLGLVLLSLFGCASQPTTIEPAPAIRRIALIPATTPLAFTLENVSAIQFLFPIAATGYHLDSREKAKIFNERLRVQPSRLAAELTDTVAAALRRYGYEVELLQGVSRPPDDPDDVDYDAVATSADAVLHLRFDEVGLFSPRSSTSYLPRVNASGTLFVKGREDYLFEQDVRYGVDARAGKPWAIAAPESVAYPDFESVIGNLGAVLGAFDAGAAEVGKRLSEQVHASIRQP